MSDEISFDELTGFKKPRRATPKELAQRRIGGEIRELEAKIYHSHEVIESENIEMKLNMETAEMLRTAKKAIE